ncbi:MAG: hypothetical protein M1818_001305 [Claussenomyces sp. TS43310]|nr:MAG: hypothetical protein M1818_001305 [Claussenomyces sp. TS43310]
MARMHALKNHMVAFLGEFVGTFMFLFISFAGAQTAGEVSGTNTNEKLINLLYICTVFGFSLLVNVWLFFRISGGLFNPAVTVALCLVGAVPPLRSVFIFVAQIIAGIAAAGLAEGLVPESSVMFDVALSPTTSIVRGLFLEVFCTAQLIFAVLMLAAEKTKATFLAPIGIGLSLFVAMLVSLNWTGGSLNPARAFGPAVVKHTFPGYHWVYWVGPLLGALLAVGFYKLMKILHYEEVSGDQDKSAWEEQTMPKSETDDDPEKALESRRRNSRQSAQSNYRNSHSAHGHGANDAAGGNGQARRPSSRDYSTGRQQTDRQSGPNSRAYAPDGPSQYGGEQSRGRHERDAPSFPVTQNGEPYLQDSDAQTRGNRKSSQRRHQRNSSGSQR